MPFKKVGENDYTSPSGRHFNSAQVRLYYSHGGSFPGQSEDKKAAKSLAQKHPKSKPPKTHPAMA
jgi:hypothetical protein